MPQAAGPPGGTFLFLLKVFFGAAIRKDRERICTGQVLERIREGKILILIIVTLMILIVLIIIFITMLIILKRPHGLASARRGPDRFT